MKRHLHLVAFGAMAVMASTATMIAVQPAAAQGVVESAFGIARAEIITMVVALIIGGALGYVVRTVDGRAKIAEAKAEQDRTLLDKAAIEADRRLDALNIAQLEVFVTRFVAARYDKILGSPSIQPLREADQMATAALEQWQHRNPELAQMMHLDRESMTEILAAAIGRAAVGVQGAIPISTITDTPPASGS
jgi:hypothetical protein